MQHVLTAEQFEPEQLEGLFQQAEEYQAADHSIDSRRELMQKHFGRIMLSMFYEPSTRTRFSFSIAAVKLGLSVVGTENAAEFSSAAKGESIEDTIRVFNGYGVDAISLRTSTEGEAAKAASVAAIPILNGGDGKGEHPTQAALDLFTIHKELGRLNDLNVVIGGDLANGRTARSLALLLSKYRDNSITFVSTPELQIGNDIKAKLSDHSTRFYETVDMYDALRGSDVVYWTRLQLERMDKKLSMGQELFILDSTALEVMPKGAIIMHPLPRQAELPKSVDLDPRARYFEQASNGLYVRMAMLDQILTK